MSFRIYCTKQLSIWIKKVLFKDKTFFIAKITKGVKINVYTEKIC